MGTRDHTIIRACNVFGESLLPPTRSTDRLVHEKDRVVGYSTVISAFTEESRGGGLIRRTTEDDAPDDKHKGGERGALEISDSTPRRPSDVRGADEAYDDDQLSGCPTARDRE